MRNPNHILLDVKSVNKSLDNKYYRPLKFLPNENYYRQTANLKLGSNNPLSSRVNYFSFLKKELTTRLAPKTLFHKNTTTQAQTPLEKSYNILYFTQNINFLRKEKLYTKLKYSRSPAYDIVSGGAAAIFAGFIGFLISEKFGFELADSGDFYYLFMYLVFLAFMLRPLLTTLGYTTGVWNALSPYRIIHFFIKLLTLLKKYLV